MYKTNPDIDIVDDLKDFAYFMERHSYGELKEEITMIRKAIKEIKTLREKVVAIPVEG